MRNSFLAADDSIQLCFRTMYAPATERHCALRPYLRWRDFPLQPTHKLAESISVSATSQVLQVAHVISYHMPPRGTVPAGHLTVPNAPRSWPVRCCFARQRRKGRCDPVNELHATALVSGSATVFLPLAELTGVEPFLRQLRFGSPHLCATYVGACVLGAMSSLQSLSQSS